MTAIKVELELVDGSFTTRMLHAGETIEQFNRNVSRSSPELRRLAESGQFVIRSMDKAEGSSRSFLGTLRDVSIVVGLVSLGFQKFIGLQDGMIGKIVQANAAFERLVYQMRAMSGASDPIKDAAQNVNYLLESAKKSPFSLDALTKSFTKLKSTGTDPMKGSLDALQDGVAAFGGSDEVFDRATLAITQMSGKGVVQMEELRQQLGEAMPQAVGLMASSMGVSMAALISKISSGRLAAKESLDLFYAELDRSFGGTAQRMMQSFNGQLAANRTAWQQFSLTIGDIDKETGVANKGGFFATLTDQLRDFNQALTSVDGTNLAKSIGNGLTEVIQWLRSAADTAYEFRAAIGDFAMFVGGVAAIKLFVGGLKSLRDAYTGVVQSLQIARAAFAAADTAAAAHARALNNVATSIEEVDRLGRVAASQGLRAMLTSMVRFAPAATIIGLAIYEIADAFDVFGHRGKEAIETLREFGRIAQDQVGKAQKNITDRQEELNKQIAEIRRNAGNMISFKQGDARKKAIQEEIQAEFEKQGILEQQNQILKDQAALNENNRRQAEENAQRESDMRLQPLQALQEGEEREYRLQRERIQREHDDRIQAAKTTGEDLDAIEKDRQEKLYENAKTFLDQQAKDVKQLQDSLNETNNKKQGPWTQTDLLLGDKLAKKLDEIREKQQNLKPFGALPDIGQTSNSEKNFEKGEKLLDKTKEQVESLKEQLFSANKELDDFHAKFAAGAYGNTSSTQVQELGAEMEKLLVQKKALDDVLDGKKDIEQDLEHARIKLIEDRMALEEKANGKTLTEGEKIITRIKEGYYKGFGPNSPTIQGINATTDGLMLQGRASTSAGNQLRNAFGQQTVGKIVTLTDRLKDMLNVLTGIGTSVGAIKFDGMGTPGALAGGFAGQPGLVQNVQPTRDAENLMATALQHLMEKGWSQVAASGIVGNLMGESGLNVNARAVGDGRDGSDSIGIAQWNSDRAQKLMGYAQLGGKNWNDLFTQLDFLDHELRTSHKSAGDAIMGSSTASGAAYQFMKLFERPSDHAMAVSGPKRAGFAEHAYSMGNTSGPTIQRDQPLSKQALPSDAGTDADPTLQQEVIAFKERQIQLQDQYLKKAAEIDAGQKKLNEDQKAQAATDYKSGLLTKIETAKESLDGFDKNYRATMQLITKGEFGSKDPTTENNKALLDIAKQLDQVEKERGDRKEASNRIDSAEKKLKEDELNMERQIADLKAKAKDPNARLDTSALISLRDQMTKYVDDVELVYNKDSDEYKAAVARKASVLKSFNQQQLLEETVAGNEVTRAQQASMMTEAQQRQYYMNQELDAVDKRVAYYKQAGVLDVQATQAAEAQKAAIRQKYTQQSPITKQLKEWGDLQGNLEKAATGWMDSMVDGIAGLITGTGDLRSAIQGMANDLIKISLKAMISNMKGGATPAAGSATGAKALFSKVGQAHTGGLAGMPPQMRMIDPSVFKGARRLHSGAMSMTGPRLLPGEVPIIAKKDEGIFTPEQMKALGAGQGGQINQVSINAPVTVNASGGSPAQNADLAKQVAQEMEGSMRRVVADEMVRQMRPGNIMNSGRRT